VRRRGLQKRAKESLEEAKEAEVKRLKKIDEDIADAEYKFNDDHRDEIEAAQAYASRDPADDEEVEGEPLPIPVMPIFNKNEMMATLLGQNPPVFIPDEPEEEIDNDWVLTPAENEHQINIYLGRD